MTDDRRLIEDYIPINAINIVAQREKIGHAALHPRKLHLWWARRPLAAARAAVYATLVHPQDAPDNARDAEFFTALCRWGASDRVIAEARQRVLKANGGRPPKVLDQFAGGGAIPLEALRLGCDATSVELNPVAHLIEKCMLEYPQRFGPSLAGDIREQGRRWVERAWARVGHLYPRLRDADDEQQLSIDNENSAQQRAAGRPIAYLWTRTVRCPNPERPAHIVPLVRQTWLAKKKGRHIALRPVVDRKRADHRLGGRRGYRPQRAGLRPGRVLQAGGHHVPGLRRSRRRQARQGRGPCRADGGHAAGGGAREAWRQGTRLPRGRHVPGTRLRRVPRRARSVRGPAS